MGLPTSRDVTLGPASAWPSSLGNALQDCIVGRKHPTRTLILSIAAPAVFIPNVQLVSLSGSTGTATASWFRQIDGLEVGERITALRARVADNASGPTKLTLGLSHATAGGGPVGDGGTVQQSSGTGAIQTISVTGLASVVASGLQYVVNVSIVSGSATCTLYQVEVDLDRL